MGAGGGVGVGDAVGEGVGCSFAGVAVGCDSRDCMGVGVVEGSLVGLDAVHAAATSTRKVPSEKSFATFSFGIMTGAIFENIFRWDIA